VFDALSDRLQAALGDVRSRGKLSEDDVNAAMRQVRLALLEADVNFKVVKQFTAAVKERALGQNVLQSLNPGQQVVKIVSDELTQLMGGSGRELAFAKPGPTVILMAGLQGSGKTTACGKLAVHLREEHGMDVAVAACDVYRPAAVEQLIKVGGQAGAHVYEQGTGRDPVDIAEWALDQAKRDRRDALIVDTSGRLHVDEELMKELAEIKKRTKPHDVLLVVDAMTGQDAVAVAETFAEAAEFDGVVMTKLDGDARGGAALSVKAVTGKPILFASTGEKLEAFERFHPDRMASRILDLGDILTLIEQAQQAFDEEEAMKMAEKLATDSFTLEDFLDQMQQLKKMGSMKKMLGMLPGMGNMKQQLEDFDEKDLDRTEAIIRSMTPIERRNPKVLNGSRRLRIARGSGMTVTDVNQLVQRFDAAAKMMKTVARGGTPNIPGMGPIPGTRPGASAKRGKQQKAKGSRSGNPAKRAAENAGIAASAPAAPTGSGFGLGAGAGKNAPSEADLAELQKLLGRG
jgi:signal recognition particle subunit SRP54